MKGSWHHMPLCHRTATCRHTLSLSCQHQLGIAGARETRDGYRPFAAVRQVRKRSFADRTTATNSPPDNAASPLEPAPLRNFGGCSLLRPLCVHERRRGCLALDNDSLVKDATLQPVVLCIDQIPAISFHRIIYPEYRTFAVICWHNMVSKTPINQPHVLGVNQPATP